jgi:hypothetical protein
MDEAAIFADKGHQPTDADLALAKKLLAIRLAHQPPQDCWGGSAQCLKERWPVNSAAGFGRDLFQRGSLLFFVIRA